MSEHAPRRPVWDCGACQQPWPCAPAKVQLSEEFGRQRVNLSVYMTRRMHDAVVELAGVTPHVMYERFVRWTR